MTDHKRKWMNDVSYEIDIGIYEFVEKLRSAGCRTYSSCEGGPLSPHQWVNHCMGPNDELVYMGLNNIPTSYRWIMIHNDDIPLFNNMMCKKYNILYDIGSLNIYGDVDKTDVCIVYWEV